MKFKGEERASIQIKGNARPEICLSNITLYQLLNTGIKSIIINELKKYDDIKRYSTEYITINNLKLSQGTKVNIRFLIFPQEDNYNLYPEKLSAYLSSIDVKDIYNNIVILFEDYAYDMDTDIDNIIIELTELEVLKEEE